MTSDFEERGPGHGAHDRVAHNALGKARDVAGRPGIDGVVVGADTEVSLDDHTFGKPADAAAALAMLDALQGRTHQVHTGLALVAPDGRIHHEVVRSDVTMRSLTTAEQARYVATGEWRDRAGGYAIQGAGAALISRIEGDYSAVVGLPIARLAELIEGPFAYEARASQPRRDPGVV